MPAPERDLAGWATSGTMALTGRGDGPPLVAPGDVAGAVRRDLTRVAAAAVERGAPAPELPGVELLGERAAVAGLRRDGPRSCGGAFRTVPALDGWFGLTLARPEDVELVPALTERDVPDGTDPWTAVEAWTSTVTRADATERASLLGLPHATWPPLPLATRAPVVTTSGGRRPHLRERPLVVDLSALWAGPLCAHLLGLAGCDVVKVEDAGRPDGARRGPADFFDLLHAGHDTVSVDLARHGSGRLLELLHRADLVVESSRPRALRQHGVLAEDLVAAGVSWLSVTARGRSDDAVGFGDDVAVTAGLAIERDGLVLPVGDAVADPLTGVRAAASGAVALLDDHATLIDVSMAHVAASCTGPDVDDHEVVRAGTGWQLRTAAGSWPVAEPRRRPVAGRAGAVGRDDRRWWP